MKEIMKLMFCLMNIYSLCLETLFYFILFLQRLPPKVIGQFATFDFQEFYFTNVTII